MRLDIIYSYVLHLGRARLTIVTLSHHCEHHTQSDIDHIQPWLTMVKLDLPLLYHSYTKFDHILTMVQPWLTMVNHGHVTQGHDPCLYL